PLSRLERRPEMLRANFASGLLFRAFRTRGFLSAALAALRGDQFQRLFEGDGGWILALGQRGVALAVGHIGSVTAIAHGRLAAIRMLAQLLQRGRGSPSATIAGLRLLFGNNGDRAVEPDCKDILDAFQVGIAALMHEERSVTPYSC